MTKHLVLFLSAVFFLLACAKSSTQDPQTQSSIVNAASALLGTWNNASTSHVALTFQEDGTFSYEAGIEGQFNGTYTLSTDQGKTSVTMHADRGPSFSGPFNLRCDLVFQSSNQVTV